MKTKLIVCAFVAFLFTFNGNAQQTQLKKADKKYDSYAFIDAIKVYEQVAEKGHKSVDLFQKLGNAYYFNAELEKANLWYTELFALGEPVDAEYFYRYSQTLKAVGNYDKANEMLEKFSEKNQKDLRALQFEKNANYLEIIKQNSGKYTIDNAGINSALSDYGSSFLGNQLVFSSNREVEGISKKIQKWTNQYYTGFFTSTINKDGSLEPPIKFLNDLETKYNEATPVFTKDGKTMYFTRNNYNNGKRGKDDDKTVGLKIYKATSVNGKWSKAIELPFNSDQYNVAHPALSPDEKSLYFASNMPGTYGESDIFKVAINNDGTFGKPINLGTNINTEGRETFPFITAENDLFFASDGHPGLGGLDIYSSKIQNGAVTLPVNIGEPINSQFDDFAILLDIKNEIGFFSSNRAGGLGYDDIYKLKFIKCTQLLAGIITDFHTNEVLANAKLTLYDESMKQLKETYSDKDGKYTFDVDCNKKYYVKAEKEEYSAQEKNIITPDKSGETELPFALEKESLPIKPGDNLAKIFNIKEILFDLDKSNIRPDAALELEKIISVMKEYPSMVIDIRSHTDCRASHAYNEKLSDRRAKSTMNYMIAQGISRERLSAKGFGEVELVNKCSDGVQCTEDEHQANRRSEFIIVKM